MKDVRKLPEPSSHRVLILAVLIVLLHFSFLMAFFAPAISTPDAQGYFTQARSLALNGTTCLHSASPLQYLGPHWSPTGEGGCVTTFSPGLPALLAVMFKWLGPVAALLVNPSFTSATLRGLFFLCRSWVGEKWALLAVLMMAVNPFLNEHALFGDAHAAVDFFFIWGLALLAFWIETGSSWQAPLCGLCAGIIPTIRYPELIFLPAFAVFAAWKVWAGGLSKRSLVIAGLGAPFR